MRMVRMRAGQRIEQRRRGFRFPRRAAGEAEQQAGLLIRRVLGQQGGGRGDGDGKVPGIERAERDVQAGTTVGTHGFLCLRVQTGEAGIGGMD